MQHWKAAPCRRVADAAARPTGVQERGTCAREPPRNLGDLVVSAHLYGGSGVAGPTPRPPDARADAEAGSERIGTVRYRGAKATKRRGMGGEESERFVVPAKPGNRPIGTRWREGGAV